MILAFGLNVMELVVIFLVVLLLFGAKRIPELAKSLGVAKREFMKAQETVAKERDELLGTPKEKPVQEITVKPAELKNAAIEQNASNRQS